MTEQELREKFTPGKLFRIVENYKHTRVVYGSNFLVLRLEITEERIDLLLLSEKQIMRAGWVKVKWIEQHRYFADYDISWLKEV